MSTNNASTITPADFPSPEAILSDSFLEKYRGRQPDWGFNSLGRIIFSRTYSRLKNDGKYEEWNETVERCVRGAQEIGACYTKEEAEQLYDLVFNLKCNFAGRSLWQLGTDKVRKYSANSLINCFFKVIKDPEDFCFIFENLMMGAGVGFSVQKENIHELPKIRFDVDIEHQNTNDADFIVPDSREGWVELLRRLLDAYFYTGKSFSYSTVLVRAEGSPIKGFGGTASGPKILVDGIDNICKIFRSREGKKLRSIDVLDICNIIASIVVAGNIRRSSQIALGDADDLLFLQAKRWDKGIPNWRAMSNNTIYADNYSYLTDEFWKGYDGIGEPYGLFNLDLSRSHGRLIDGPMSKSNLYPAKKDNVNGGNPCQPGWAPILTKTGIKKLSDIKIGDLIWSKEGWTKVLNKWSTGVKDVYRYTTTSSTFYGTENHRIVSDGDKIEVDLAESIDRLCGPLSDIEHNPQDIMDGLVLGDGSVHKASNNLVHLFIGNNDQDYLKSEVAPLVVKHRSGLNPKAYEIETSILDKELNYTYLRIIPDRFYYGNANRVASFLRGLYSANGSICGDRITLKSTSRKLIEQVQIMLSSLGIGSYITINKAKINEFENGSYPMKESYDLNITSDRIKFAKCIGFIQNYKNTKLNQIIDSKRPSKSKTSYEIIDKEFISQEEVFDITVDNDSHTYWTGGCNVSNCNEISLNGEGESCNLGELYLNNISSLEELILCSRLLYKTMKAICSLPYLHECTDKIVKKNFRLGLGVTGVCQSINKIDWLDECYKQLRRFDKEWSHKRGWPESIKLTTCKPSGTLSLLSGSSPGIHPGYSEYFIRRVRMSSEDKLISYCRDIGCHIEPQVGFDGTIDHKTLIVEFPCKFENTILAKDMTAIAQLELVKKLQTVWSDNAVSCTVYYRKEELPSIKEWLKNNYESSVKTVSFLLHQDHGFKQAPYEEISKEEYIKRCAYMKIIEASNDALGGHLLENMECAGGSCPIR